MRITILALLLAATPATVAQPVFTDVTSGDLLTSIRSWGTSWVDVDGDGDLDLFVSRFGTTGGNLLFVNEEGAFTRSTGSPLTDGDGSVGHTWGDYDNDGDPDVLTTGGGVGGFGDTGGPSVLYRNDGGLTFTAVETGPLAPSENNLGWGAAWGDFDNDGWLDAVIAHPVGFFADDQLNHLVRSKGDGTFTRITDSPIVTGSDTYTVPTWSDYDLDGDLDLFIGSGPATGAPDTDNLYENDGTGTFTRLTTDPIATDPRDGQTMNWIDYDNDGDFDLFVTNYFNTIRDDLYRNDGGNYSEVTTASPVTDAGGFSLANAWGDMDNDGDLDLFITTDGSASDRYYDNNGDGTFTRITGLAPTMTSDQTSGATLGDYDNDGDLDLAVAHIGFVGESLRLYRNDLSAANTSFQIRTVGTASNRDGIGAKVWVTATIFGETVTQVREISVQNTYNGHHAIASHFGLGDAAMIDEVRIEWPSGTVDTYTALDLSVVGRFATAVEGESLLPVAEEPDPSLPVGTALHAASPNPFTHATTLRYTLDAPSSVTLTVYDVLGRVVTVLVDEAKPSGAHEATFGADALPTGLYLIRLTHASGSETRMVTLTH